MTIHCFTDATNAYDQSLLVTVCVYTQIGETYSKNAIYNYTFFSGNVWTVKSFCKEPIPNLDVQLKLATTLDSSAVPASS